MLKLFINMLYLLWISIFCGNEIFQENNAPPHHSKVAITACEDAKIVTLQWPAQSPDLNPIKNIWAEMKAMMCHHIPLPFSIKELEKNRADIFILSRFY
jgi:transposase